MGAPTVFGSADDRRSGPGQNHFAAKARRAGFRKAMSGRAGAADRQARDKSPAQSSAGPGGSREVAG
jgi:hypothetical protein